MLGRRFQKKKKDILDTIKGKTILPFEVINTICSRTPSVCISELFPDNARLIEAGGAHCLVRKTLTEQCGCGLHCALNVTHSSWYIKPRMLSTDWVTVGFVGLEGPSDSGLFHTVSQRPLLPCPLQ